NEISLYRAMPPHGCRDFQGSENEGRKKIKEKKQWGGCAKTVNLALRVYSENSNLPVFCFMEANSPKLFLGQNVF
ncbi:hypothetical protein LZC07_09800, partial [Campylobacter coli]|uniref:hypothetical protein n=1 Tax=Campylobacter coli TaxID=195 RepID=UPI001F08F03B